MVALIQQVLFNIVFIFTVINSECSYVLNDTCIIIPNSSDDIICPQNLDCNVILNGTNHDIENVVCPIGDNICIIDCISPNSCKDTEILASHSKQIYINIGGIDSGKNMEINGPAKDDGELFINLINNDSDFYHSSITAKPNSAKIIIDCRIGNKCSHNIINGRNINSKQSNISILCNGPNSADCSNTNLSCSSHSYLSSNSSQNSSYSSSCNFHCKSCSNSNVYAINGKYDINWNCDQNDKNSCFNSKIYCGSNYTLYNELIYNEIESKWDYKNNECNFNSSISVSTGLESSNFITALLLLDPLYYIIFVLSLSLLCVLCILIFWVYHQQRWNKQLRYSQTKMNSHIKYEQELFRVASIESVPSSRFIPNTNDSPQKNGESSPASHISGAGDIVLPSIHQSPPSKSLQSKSIQSIQSNSIQSVSKISNPRKYKTKYKTKSNQITKQHFKDNTTISGLSGIPESQISELSLAVNHDKYQKASIDDTLISTLVTESSTASSSSSSSSSSDSDDASNITNMTNTTPLSMKKNKFALPVSYLKSAYTSNDTDMNLEQRQIGVFPSKPYSQLRVPDKVIAARKNKTKTNMIKFGKHRKQTSNTTSMVSELTQVTENTEFTGVTTKVEDSECSSASSTVSLSSHSNEEEEEEELEVDVQSEYTIQTEETSFMNDDNQTIISNNTFTDNDNGTFMENSRITYDTTQKKMTIESAVLDADIMDDLYDNKIKPLELSEKIEKLQAQIDDVSSDSNAPSPKSLSINTRKETESTNLYFGYINNNLDASTISTISTLATTAVPRNNI